MREVVFFQSKFPSSEEALVSLLQRWESYAVELKNSSDQPVITIFSPFKILENREKYPHLLFMCKSRNVLINIQSLFLKVKSSRQPITIVCGDNQFSLLLSVICRQLFKRKVFIQCQFHGDIYSRQVNFGVKGFFRTSTSRFAIKMADSIRIVSEFQEHEIRGLFPEIHAKFIIAPISIDYIKIPKAEEHKDLYDVAIIGRFHYERGIDQALLIIRQLLFKNPRLRIVFVGSGVEMKMIVHHLKDEISNGSVSVLGALPAEKLRSIYAQSKVLLSAAPREGYGLTLREAYLSGLTVVARDSSGSREATRDFPSRFSLFNSVDEGVSQILKALGNHSPATDLSISIREQQSRESAALERLIQSWTKD